MLENIPASALLTETISVHLNIEQRTSRQTFRYED